MTLRTRLKSPPSDGGGAEMRNRKAIEQVRNRKAIEGWQSGHPAGAGNLVTDGSTLWSYKLVIGVTDENRRKVLYDYRAPAGHFRSMTTSQHVSAAATVADRVIEPPGAIEPRRERKHRARPHKVEIGPEVVCLNRREGIVPTEEG